MVTQTEFHNQSDCRQHYWFLTACACAIPVLLQLSESSFEGLKCIVYSLPMNILKPCHPVLINFPHHSLFLDQALALNIYDLCLAHQTCFWYKDSHKFRKWHHKPSLCEQFGTVLYFSQNETTGSGSQESSWGRYISHGLLCRNMSSNCPAVL